MGFTKTPSTGPNIGAEANVATIAAPTMPQP